MKDYYNILGVTPESSEDDIRKSYRKLAMQYHPDRNPDDIAAEEKFKEIAEAYGVLTDPVKRREFDSCRQTGRPFGSNQGNGGFSYSQEDILKDLFNDPRFQQMFSTILQDFQRSGFRYSSQFVRKSFFGGKGSFFLGGIFLLGSMAGPLLGNSAKNKLSGKSSVLKSIGKKVTKALSGKKFHHPAPPQQDTPRTSLELDVTYHTPLSREELRDGKTVQVVVFGEDDEQTLKVRIPPGSHAGQKLRIRGKGKASHQERGDLYLQLMQKD